MAENQTHSIPSSNEKLCRVCFKSGPKGEIRKKFKDDHAIWFGKFL